MPAPSSLLDQLAQAWPPAAWQSLRVVVAVSGGADSVALLRGLHSLAGDSSRLLVGHFNHRLRPAAEADEAFVRQLAASLGLDCVVGHVAAGALQAQARDGIEAAARAARYDFLRETAERRGARYVALGHTADDQAETILHRIVRGTGLAGLAGMPRARQLSPAVTLIRPLLEVSRAEVLQYLTDLDQPYRDDETNDQTQYTRNRLRHDLLPKLRADYNPEVNAALLRLGRLAAEAQSFLQDPVAELLDRCVTRAAPQTLVIACESLAGSDPYLVREFFAALWRRENWPQQAMTFEHWRQLAALAQQPLANAQRAVQTLPAAIRAEKQGGELRLTFPAGESRDSAG